MSGEGIEILGTPLTLLGRRVLDLLDRKPSGNREESFYSIWASCVAATGHADPGKRLDREKRS